MRRVFAHHEVTDEDEEARQTRPGPHFNGEEIRRGEDFLSLGQPCPNKRTTSMMLAVGYCSLSHRRQS
jgi:hypothetical protein